MEIVDRVAELKRHAELAEMPGRLLKGAEVLGRLWKSDIRCKDGWRRGCGCHGLATDFCHAKLKWLDIRLRFQPGLLEEWEMTGEEEYFVVEAMMLKQFEASGITAVVGAPGVEGQIRFGTKGTYWWTLLDLALTVPGEDREQTWKDVVKIQKAA